MSAAAASSIELAELAAKLFSEHVAPVLNHYIEAKRRGDDEEVIARLRRRYERVHGKFNEEMLDRELAAEPPQRTDRRSRSGREDA